MINLNPKCKCKSAPSYHRDDCLFYDSYGNLKNKTEILENIINKRVRDIIDKNCPFSFKLEQIGNYFQAEIYDADYGYQEGANDSLGEFLIYFGDKLEKISTEIFQETGDIINFN